MRALISAASAVALAGCITAGAQTLDEVPADTYTLEKNHAFLSAELSHGGLSTYVIDFTNLDAELAFDPENPTASQIEFFVEPADLDTHYPDPEKKSEWEAEIANDDDVLDADTHPVATFVSTGAEATGDFTGKLTGDLTLNGVTKPVTFDVSYIGVGAFPWEGGRKRIGFKAEGVIKRSEFDIVKWLNIGIGDEVKLTFNGEFIQPEG